MRKILSAIAIVIIAISAFMIPENVNAATVKAPVIKAVKQLDDGTVRLAWDKVKKAATYRVYRKTAAEEEYTLIKKMKSTKTKFDDKTVEPGVEYEYVVTATRGSGEKLVESEKSAPVTFSEIGVPTLSSVKYDKWGETVIKWTEVPGVSEYYIYKSKKKGELGNIFAKVEAGTLKYKDHLDELPDVRVYYTVRAVVKDEAGVTYFSKLSNTKSIKALYRIMGKSRCTAEQLAAYYHMRERTERDVMYPAEYLGPGGAPTVEDFAKIVMEECEAEGVRAEVLFGQAMIETGLLLYRDTSVAPDSYNFAGMGATGAADADILEFENIRMGIRCQVQHLKAYGCKDALNNPLIDDRFKWVPRGSAAFVYWLGIPQNPIGRGWAASPNDAYGDLIVNNYVKKILAM